MVTIDLNADLGENAPDRIVGDDDAMLRIVTSANVSCGFHAGSPEGIAATLRSAVDRGVTIGAHPGYRDYAGFGRVAMEVDSATLQSQIEYQLGALQALARAAGGSSVYVKPHGALYGAIAIDERQAKVVVAAVRAIDPSLVLLGPAGGVVLEIAERAGLTTAAEAFADRAYTPEGLLVPRTEAGSVLDDPALVAARTVRLAQEGVVTAIDGSDVAVRADSICVHGDSAGAVGLAAAARAALEASGVVVAAFAA